MSRLVLLHQKRYCHHLQVVNFYPPGDKSLPTHQVVTCFLPTIVLLRVGLAESRGVFHPPPRWFADERRSEARPSMKRLAQLPLHRAADCHNFRQATKEDELALYNIHIYESNIMYICIICIICIVCIICIICIICIYVFVFPT